MTTSPTSRTPIRLIISAWLDPRSTSPGPMRRRSSGCGPTSSICGTCRGRRGRSARTSARRCRSASSIMARRRSAASPNIIPATARPPEASAPPRTRRRSRPRPTSGRGRCRARSTGSRASARSAKPNFALGAARFQQMLATPRWSTRRSSELERIGRADLERNQKLLARPAAATRRARRCRTACAG